MSGERDQNGVKWWEVFLRDECTYTTCHGARHEWPLAVGWNLYAGLHD